LAVTSSTRKGINQWLIMIVGFIVVIAAVMIFLFVLRGVFGKFSVNELVPDGRVLKNVLLGREPNVAILYSDYTQNMLPENSTWLQENITTWKSFLGYGDNKFEIITDEEIERGKLFEYELLILPGTISLSDREIIQIKKYLDKGGSIFATSGTASYSDDGKWRGWRFFSEVFGVKFSREIGDGDLTKIHTLRGGIPITANVPTGYPLHIATWDNPIAVEVLDPRTEQISFWYNYRLEEGLVREGIKKTAGMVYGKYGFGRFVWMGFDINSVIGVQEDYIYFDRMFRNCISWLEKEPIAFIKDWPSGFRAAAVLMPTLTDEVQNVRNLLPVLTNENIEATFFVEANFAQNNNELIQYLAEFGEVAAMVDIGYLASVNDTINKLYDYEVQLDNLINAKKTIEKITRKTLSGFVPYYGLFDKNTVMAIVNAGYDYLLTDSLTDRSVPRVVIKGDKRISSITKTARDDYEVIRNFGLHQPEFQFYTYQEDIDRVMFEGGLYVYKMHTDYQCKLENIEVVKDVIKELKKKKFWITTNEKIYKWYKAKDYLEIRSEKRGNSRVAVTITNPSDELVSNIVIYIDLNNKADHISIETEVIGKKNATYSHQRGLEILHLYVDDLEAGESRTFFIDFDIINS
jgi:peptidoglycan/xylan/chitin deacetylase (PgdA/CDA1 family)